MVLFSLAILKLENMYQKVMVDSSSKGNSVVYRAIYFGGTEGYHFHNFKSGKCSWLKKNQSILECIKQKVNVFPFNTTIFESAKYSSRIVYI